MIKAVVAVDNSWAIGRNDGLLTHLPKDLQRFKNITDGNVIIMGRKTLESLPGGRALPNRMNIVLTQDPNYINEDVTVVHSIPSLLAAIEGIKKLFPNVKFFVCGGGQIYKLLLPYIQEVLVTKVDFVFDDTDTFFPNLDVIGGWTPLADKIYVEDNGYYTSYITYERR